MKGVMQCCLLGGMGPNFSVFTDRQMSSLANVNCRIVCLFYFILFFSWYILSLTYPEVLMGSFCFVHGLFISKPPLTRFLAWLVKEWDFATAPSHEAFPPTVCYNQPWRFNFSGNLIRRKRECLRRECPTLPFHMSKINLGACVGER